jgi:hypothetical protein
MTVSLAATAVGVKGKPEQEDWAAVGVQEHGMWQEIRAATWEAPAPPRIGRGMRGDEIGAEQTGTEESDRFVVV